MRLAEPFACFAVVCLAASPASAQDVAFNIPAGRLGDALVSLGAQAGITIGATDPDLAAIRSRAVRGRMPVREALARLLARTGYQFTFVSARSVRITRSPDAAARRKPPPRQIAVPANSPPVQIPESEIVVTASKRRVRLEDFAGTVHVAEIQPSDVGRYSVRGTEAIIARLPMLASTNLGTGRNKVFIRGVADSSFNGQSQALVGQYLGDVRLSFNAPDPDLQLYDIKHVEVLEGPQGTLYGTGALSGIVRLVPNAPDPSGSAASFSAGLMATQHGEPGGDIAGMLNIPIARDALTLRTVGYAETDGGYIDDVGQDRRDVNRTKLRGGRASLSWTPDNDWHVELSGALQLISVDDGQYADRSLPQLERRSSFAQPFKSNYQLGALIVRKSWSSIELVSSTSVVGHDLETRFDASGMVPTAAPQLFFEDVGTTLVANETRVARLNSAGAGWVAGFSLLHNTSNIRRQLGPPGATLPITGVRNESMEVALFGETHFPIVDGMKATVGGRLTLSRTVGQPLDQPEDAKEPGRTDLLASPTAALSWHPASNILLYARYQHGFRAGGLALSASGSTTAVERFDSDSLSSVETGIRLGHPDSGVLNLNAAISYARWSNIQADLVDNRGLPFTTNLGDGRILGFELEASVKASPGLRFDVAAFINDSDLTDPDPAFAVANERDLPNVASTGGRVSVHYETAVGNGATLSIDGGLRYVGHSQLGIGPPLDLRQGGYVNGQIGARLDLGRLGISLDVDNVLDARGNRFAFGNPFRVGEGDQVTPLRPRTLRLGLDAAF